MGAEPKSSISSSSSHFLTCGVNLMGCSVPFLSLFSMHIYEARKKNRNSSRRKFHLSRPLCSVQDCKGDNWIYHWVYHSVFCFWVPIFTKCAYSCTLNYFPSHIPRHVVGIFFSAQCCHVLSKLFTILKLPLPGDNIDKRGHKVK